MIDLLLELGTTEKTFGGATKVFFDKVSRRRVYAYAGSLASLIEQHLDTYAVIGEDFKVVTVGHRNERIHRH